MVSYSSQKKITDIVLSVWYRVSRASGSNSVVNGGTPPPAALVCDRNVQHLHPNVQHLPQHASSYRPVQTHQCFYHVNSYLVSIRLMRACNAAAAGAPLGTTHTSP